MTSGSTRDWKHERVLRRCRYEAKFGSQIPTPAPPHYAPRPGSPADIALKAAQDRGPRHEDPAHTRASQIYWAPFRPGYVPPHDG